jgi:hypothetical protein
MMERPMFLLAAQSIMDAATAPLWLISARGPAGGLPARSAGRKTVSKPLKAL